MLRSWDSSPQSLTTTQEQLTTLRALPSRSIWPVSQDSQYGVFQVIQDHQGGEEKLTETSPLAELLAVRDLDQRDLVLAAESDNELLVGLLLASLVEDAHVGLATVKGLGGLTETAGKTVVDEGDLEHALERVEDRHAAAGVVGRHLDLLGRLDLLLGNLFSVRL